MGIPTKRVLFVWGNGEKVFEIYCNKQQWFQMILTVGLVGKLERNTKSRLRIIIPPTSGHPVTYYRSILNLSIGQEYVMYR